MQTGLDEIRSLRRSDRAKLRKRVIAMVIIAIVLLAVMTCLRTTKTGFVNPLNAAKNLFNAARLFLAQIFHWDIYNQRSEIINASPYYFETLGSFRGTFISMLLGAALGMSGGVYQNVFRNPIAAPNMLGISSGIGISNIILVVIFGTQAVAMVRWRFVLGFAVALGTLFFIYIVARFMSGRKSSVTDMLFLGNLLMRVVQNLINVYQYYVLDDDEYLIMEEMNLYGANIFQGNTIWIVIGVLAVSVIVLLMIRFSMNAVSFSDEEARALGVNAPRLRMIALVCGTMMVTAAQVNYGEVGMMALLVPHLCRSWFGSDFRNVLLGCAGLGAIVMTVTRLIAYFLSFNYYLSLISVGTIINLVTLPMLIIILVQRRKTWNI